MDKFKQIFMELTIRCQFEPVLKTVKDNPFINEAIQIYEQSKLLGLENCNNPEILVRLSIIKDQIDMHNLIVKLLEDILRLDWSKDETILEFESMKVCLEAMEKKYCQTEELVKFLSLSGGND